MLTRDLKTVSAFKIRSQRYLKPTFVSKERGLGHKNLSKGVVVGTPLVSNGRWVANSVYILY